MSCVNISLDKKAEGVVSPSAFSNLIAVPSFRSTVGNQEFG